MISALLLGVCFFTATPADTKETERERAVYAAAVASAGRNPDAHVQLSLWCEAHGFEAERRKQLDTAVEIAPDHSKARGLLGMLVHNGEWGSPEAVGRKVLSDETRAARYIQYHARREAIEQPHQNGRSKSRSELAHAHVALGMWCEGNGLLAEAPAHFTTALTLDPWNDATWKHLGYIKHDGRWMTKEQVAAARVEGEARRKGLREWEPRLRKLRTKLADPKHYEEAEAQLTSVTDRYAIGAVVRVFETPNTSDQLREVQLLGQIDDPEASRELAGLAVFSPSPGVRARAVETLRTCERRDYVDQLIGLIHAPMRYRVEPVRGPGSPGALCIETARYLVLRTYDAPPPVRVATYHGHSGRVTYSALGISGYDNNGLPIIATGSELDAMRHDKALAGMDLAFLEARTMTLIAEARLKAVASQQRLIADVTDIETTNAQNAATFARVALALRTAAGAPDLPQDEDEWRAWWNDRLGYRYQRPPQVKLAVNASPQDSPGEVWQRMSCFAAGTPVRTLEGLRPIEQIQVGDQVLSQNVTTGALSFQPVLAVHHNSPGATLMLSFDNGERLIASIYHRFWRSGEGWALARDLQRGDTVRFLHGAAKVSDTKTGRTVPVYNLDVADDRTFFVGSQGALVHDNSLPDARLQPFDDVPALASKAP